MTREEYLKSLEGLPDGTKENLINIFDENVKLKSIKDDAFKERDDYKKKLKELEDSKATADAEAAKQQGKFKELYESETVKVKNLETEVSQLKPYQEKLSRYEENHKKRMLEEIEDADLKKELETKSYSEVELAHSVYIKTKPKSKTGSDNGKSGLVIKDGKKWDDYKSEELDEIFAKHPDVYQQLRNEKYAKRN